MNKTEQALVAIFRHCDEVAEGKRPPRSEKEGREAARVFLGIGNDQTLPTEVGSSAIVRLPSLERGCRNKIKLGHKGYARNAERMAKKHGKRYAVYLCPYCQSTHLTTRLDGQYATELLYVCKPNVQAEAPQVASSR